MTTNHGAKGFSLVELIVYTAILTIVVAALTLTGVSLLKTFGYMQGTADIAETATVALERITREIRFAYNVDTGASTLLVSPGTLMLETTDESGNPTTLTIALVDGRIYLTEGGGAAVPITRASVHIASLVFTHTLGTHTQAVRVEMTAERNVRETLITKDFHSFAVLDAS